MKQELEAIELTQENMETMIYEIRGQKVMLDFDLARIYGYATRDFNRQVKNNIQKFPEDFMFQLSKDEWKTILMWKKSTSNIGGNLMSQKLISSWGGTRKLPYAFTESGIYMLMTVLKGELATKQSLSLIRLFKQMKDYIVDNRVLLDANSLLKIPKRLDKHDRDIRNIKHNLKEVMSNFIDPNTYKHFLIMNGEKIEADYVYQRIYQTAKKSITMIDDYIGIKTLLLLKAASPNIEITIISDNVATPKLEESFIDDFKNNVNQSLSIVPSNNRFHDRYILIDCGTENETVYHCGSSSKDTGNKITTINRLDDAIVYKELMKNI